MKWNSEDLFVLRLGRQSRLPTSNELRVTNMYSETTSILTRHMPCRSSFPLVSIIKLMWSLNCSIDFMKTFLFFFACTIHTVIHNNKNYILQIQTLTVDMIKAETVLSERGSTQLAKFISGMRCLKDLSLRRLAALHDSFHSALALSAHRIKVRVIF